MKKFFLFAALAFSCTISALSQEAPLESYVGKFNFPQGSPVPFVDVKISNGSLIGESQMGIASLQRIEADVFSIVEYNGVAEFKRNGDGKVVSIKVTVNDLIMEGTRENLHLKAIPWFPLSPLKL